MKTSKLVLAALALSLVPYELETGKDGDFSYKSLLLGLSSRKDAEGKRNLEISLFNVPDFLKKAPKEEAAPAAEPDAETADTPEAPEAPEPEV